MKAQSTPEYDAFGPWIYLIDGRHPLPPLFSAYEGQLKGCLMAFKIPRQIERRRAHPRMNLYDMVIVIFDDRILLLERIRRGNEDVVDETKVPLTLIGGMRTYSCLLSGIWSIFTPDKTVVVFYNTVSEDIIQRAIGLLRGRITPVNKRPQVEPLPFSRGTMEFSFLNVCRKALSAENDLELVAYQPNRDLSIPRQFKSALLMSLGLKESVKTGYVIFLSCRELILIQRTYFTKGPNIDSYAYRYSFLPLVGLSLSVREEAGRHQPRLRLVGNLMEEEVFLDPENAGMKRLISSLISVKQ